MDYIILNNTKIVNFITNFKFFDFILNDFKFMYEFIQKIYIHKNRNQLFSYKYIIK